MSSGGRRTLPYRAFHLGYKQTALQPAELIYAIHLPRRFGRHVQFVRKVGTRNAQAIAKIALAGVALVDDSCLIEVSLGAASLRDRPSRLSATESALQGRDIRDPSILEHAAQALAGEISPIDDIRSTRRYRETVAVNLLAELLQHCAKPTPQ